jgi:hypothetical protein
MLKFISLTAIYIAGMTHAANSCAITRSFDYSVLRAASYLVIAKTLEDTDNSMPGPAFAPIK